MARYPYEILLVVRAEDRADAASDAANLSGTAADDTPNFFAIPCSATGTEPATHYAAVTIARQVVVDALPSLEAKHPGAQWQILRRGAGGPDEERLAHWTDALEDLGLARIVPDVEDDLP